MHIDTKILEIPINELVFIASPEWLLEISTEIYHSKGEYIRDLSISLSEGQKEPLEASIWKGRVSLAEGHHRLLAASIGGLESLLVRVSVDENIFVHGLEEEIFWRRCYEQCWKMG